MIILLDLVQSSLCSLGLPFPELLLEIQLGEAYEHLSTMGNNLLKGLDEHVEAGNHKREGGCPLGKHQIHEDLEGLEDNNDCVNLASEEDLSAIKHGN